VAANAKIAGAYTHTLCIIIQKFTARNYCLESKLIRLGFLLFEMTRFEIVNLKNLKRMEKYD